LDGADTASVPLAADGRYRVAVFVAVGDEWVGLDAVEPAEIDVAANGAPQAFEVRVDPVAVREAVAMRSR
jgi:hypothetical protein